MRDISGVVDEAILVEISRVTRVLLFKISSGVKNGSVSDIFTAIISRMLSYDDGHFVISANSEPSRTVNAAVEECIGKLPGREGSKTIVFGAVCKCALTCTVFTVTYESFVTMACRVFAVDKSVGSGIADICGVGRLALPVRSVSRSSDGNVSVLLHVAFTNATILPSLRVSEIIDCKLTVMSLTLTLSVVKEGVSSCVVQHSAS